jgi:hypothetical protein
LTTRSGADELTMVAQDTPAAATLKPERNIGAKVTLKDGRVLPLITAVDAPRPRVLLMGKSVQSSPSGKDSNIQLTDSGELPQDATISFAVRTQWPAAFARDESMEVTAGDESSTTVLNFANGGMTLENAQVAVATLNPAKTLGPSAFGPVQFRVIAKGIAGDWQLLGTLVRMPVLRELTCPSTQELACKLAGSNLFLIDSVSNNPQFDHPLQVPEGFLGVALPVPHPISGPLYIKLRDNPTVINSTTLETKMLPPPADDSGRASARQSAVPPENPPTPQHSDEADPSSERHHANP